MIPVNFTKLKTSDNACCTKCNLLDLLPTTGIAKYPKRQPSQEHAQQTHENFEPNTWRGQIQQIVR